MGGTGRESVKSHSYSVTQVALQKAKRAQNTVAIYFCMTSDSIMAYRVRPSISHQNSCCYIQVRLFGAVKHAAGWRRSVPSIFERIFVLFVNRRRSQPLATAALLLADHIRAVGRNAFVFTIRCQANTNGRDVLACIQEGKTAPEKHPTIEGTNNRRYPQGAEQGRPHGLRRSNGRRRPYVCCTHCNIRCNFCDPWAVCVGPASGLFFMGQPTRGRQVDRGILCHCMTGSGLQTDYDIPME